LLGFYISANAVKLNSKKKFIKVNNPEAQKFTKKTFSLSKEQISFLKTKCGIKEVSPKHSFILGKTAEGEITGAVYLITIYATEHNCVHHMGIALDPEGKVKAVSILEAFCEYVLRCASQSFLGQFPNKSKTENLKFNEDINGITGATLTCQVITDVVNFTVQIYREYIKAS
jgi:hypothetical protein